MLFAGRMITVESEEFELMILRVACGREIKLSAVTLTGDNFRT